VIARTMTQGRLQRADIWISPHGRGFIQHEQPVASATDMRPNSALSREIAVTRPFQS